MKKIYELKITRCVQETTTVYIEASEQIHPGTLDEPEVAAKIVSALDAPPSPLWRRVNETENEYDIDAKEYTGTAPVLVCASLKRPSFWDVRVTRFTE